MSIKCGEAIGMDSLSSDVIMTFDLLGPKLSPDQNASGSLSSAPNLVNGDPSFDHFELIAHKS